MDRDRKRPHGDERGDRHSKSHRSDRDGRSRGVRDDDSNRRTSSNSSSSSNSPGPGQGPNGPPGAGVGVQSRLAQMAANSSAQFNLEEAAVNDRGRRKDGGEGDGRRARRPRPTAAQMADFVPTRELTVAKSVPTTDANRVNLKANFFELKSRQTWNVYRYHVDFDPVIEKTYDKHILLRPHGEHFGKYAFDGSAIYTPTKIPDDKLELWSAKEGSDDRIKISIKGDPLVIASNDPMNTQIYNILLRESLRQLKLRLMGRYYYDDSPKGAIIHNREKLEIWLGFKTSIRQHERSLMLCVDMTNKVLHQDTMLAYIRSKESQRWDQNKITNGILNQVIMTTYNIRPYKISDVKWDQTPRTTFEYQGNPTSYAAYLQMKYNITVRDMNQPILFSMPKRNERRRGMNDPIALIPELCRLTGLTDDQRKDFQLMKTLSRDLQLDPDRRVRKILGFEARLSTHGVRERIFAPAGLDLSRRLVELAGRQLPAEKIRFAAEASCTPTVERLDWSNDLQRNHMRETVDLKQWAIIMEDEAGVDSFIDLIKSRGRSMNFRIAPPVIKKRVQADRHRRVQNFLQKLDEIISENSRIQMIVIMLPVGADEQLYGEIKRKCYLEYGVSSQCVQMRHLRGGGRPDKLAGVATKLAIQMNTKLGGVPWDVIIPVKGLMVVGYNISHMSTNRSAGGRSIGALVATMNDPQSKFFSVLVELERGQSLATTFSLKMTLILREYQKKNEGRLPTRIMFYRDGVGEGQLQSVVDTEVDEIEKAFHDVYGETVLPLFAFTVVNKRINTKFFTRKHNEYGNPLPGTVVDDVVTFPERYDFYLISQKGTGQGTVSPTAYNVIRNRANLPPDKFQMLTHKLTHLYYNWNSTVAIPHVCQYASKLAFLQNLIIKAGNRASSDQDPRPQLASTLYYI